MSDSITQPVETQPAATQPQPAVGQVTSKIPTTKPAKNPKRVAAGKAVAEKTRQAREAQKKAAAEAAVIIANNKSKETPAPHVPDPNAVGEDTNTTRNVLTTTQWLSVVSIFVSMIGIYYKREEIKRVFSKKPPQTPPPSPEMQRPPPQPKKGIRPAD